MTPLSWKHFPVPFWSRVKDQSLHLMKSSVCHIMRPEVMEGCTTCIMQQEPTAAVELRSIHTNRELEE